jgi:hypothetical protein
MTVFLAKAISIVFHPIFMPLFGLWIVFQSDTILHLYFQANSPAEEQRYINSLYLVFFLTTVVMPSISFYILKRNKMVSSLAMPERKERFMPYISTLVYYIMLYYLLRSGHYDQKFLSAVLGTVLVLFTVLLFNLKIKISAHAAGVAGVAALYAVLLKQEWIVNGLSVLGGLIVLTGLVSSARLTLKAHREKEIYLGILVGFLVMFIVMNFKLYI